MSEKPKCEGGLPMQGLYFPTVFRCFEDELGQFWITNHEAHEAQVAFCPYCGQKAPVAPVLTPII